MMRTQSSLSSLLAAALVATLAACETTPLAPTTPGELVTDVVADEVFAGMGPATTRMLSLNLSQRGTLELTATWQDPANTVLVVLTEARCRDLDLLGTSDCRARPARSHETRQDRETAVYREAAGSYRLWVVNRGPGADTVAVTARLTYQEGDTAPTDPHEPGEPRRGRDPVTN